MKNYADLGGCYHFTFSPLPFSPFPRHCYLKYPQNKRSRARDWGKGSGWKRVWASPTYRDSSTFKIRSFPTSHSRKVPKVRSLKWWIFLNSLFDPTYNFFNVLYFFNFVCRAPKLHKNCRPKNSCEVKSFLFSYELVHGAYDTNKSIIHITNLMCHNGLHIISRSKDLCPDSSKISWYWSKTNSHLILKPNANLLRLSAYIFLLENTINTEKKQKFTYMWQIY